MEAVIPEKVTPAEIPLALNLSRGPSTGSQARKGKDKESPADKFPWINMIEYRLSRGVARGVERAMQMEKWQAGSAVSGDHCAIDERTI